MITAQNKLGSPTDQLIISAIKYEEPFKEQSECGFAFIYCSYFLLDLFSEYASILCYMTFRQHHFWEKEDSHLIIRNTLPTKALQIHFFIHTMQRVTAYFMTVTWRFEANIKFKSRFPISTSCTGFIGQLTIRPTRLES